MAVNLKDLPVLSWSGATTRYSSLTIPVETGAPLYRRPSEGQRVSFQTWTWEGDNYHLIQYIIEDEATLQISKFQCAYRATRRDELTNILTATGCKDVQWLFPEESGFYQPIVVAHK